MEYIILTLENKELKEQNFKTMSKALIHANKLSKKGFENYDDLKKGYQEKTYKITMKT